MIQFLPLLAPVLERLASLIPDPEARSKAIAQAQTEMVNALQQSDAAQNQVNNQEAQNASLFVSGWRPAAGWICVVGLFYELLLRPILPWIAAVLGEPNLPILPDLGDDLWVLLCGMLGLGTLRSYEKVRNINTR